MKFSQVHWAAWVNKTSKKVFWVKAIISSGVLAVTSLKVYKSNFMKLEDGFRSTVYEPPSFFSCFRIFW